jgi:hypothetical protein
VPKAHSKAKKCGREKKDRLSEYLQHFISILSSNRGSFSAGAMALPEIAWDLA